jgi:hypothetical protein
MKELTPDQLLAAEVESVFDQFMYLPNKHASTVMTLWVEHTHLRNADEEFQPYITPRLAFLSKQAGSGKSLATELVTKLSFNGEMVLEPTPPSITTLMNVDHATVGFDEIDTYFGRGSGKLAMRAILNGGYKRGSSVTRQRSNEADRQNVYGPIVMNGKNANLFLTHANFETLRSRTISIVLEPKPRDYYVDRFNPEIYDSRLYGLMRRLRRWGVNNYRAVLSIPIDGLMPDRIANRAEEIWTVLFRVAEHLGGVWPQRVEEAARAMVLGEWDAADDKVLSPAEEVLAGVRAVFTDADEFLPTTVILERLFELPQPIAMVEEWALVPERAQMMGLARTLGLFGHESSRRQVDGEQARGFSRDDVGLDPAPMSI